MLIDVTDDIVPRPSHGRRPPTPDEMVETRGAYETDRVPAEPMKVCRQCGASYPATPEYWHRHATMADRLDNRCKPCKSLIWAKRKAEGRIHR
jgi:hypothetical protein